MIIIIIIIIITTIVVIIVIIPIVKIIGIIKLARQLDSLSTRLRYQRAPNSPNSSAKQKILQGVRGDNCRQNRLGGRHSDRWLRGRSVPAERRFPQRLLAKFIDI
jgi:hypothetical protein